MKGATVSFIFRDNKKSFFIALSDILGIILQKCLMELWLDSKDFFFLLLLGKKPNSHTLREVCQALNGASTEYCSSEHTDHCNAYKCLWAGLMQVWSQCSSKDEFRSGKAMTWIWSWSVTTADPVMDVAAYQTVTLAWKGAATLMALGVHKYHHS